jgi:hypothetical protein
MRALVPRDARVGVIGGISGDATSMFSGALAGALLLKTSLVLPLNAAAGLALATWLYAKHHRELGSSCGNA